MQLASDMRPSFPTSGTHDRYGLSASSSAGSNLLGTAQSGGGRTAGRITTTDEPHISRPPKMRANIYGARRCRSRFIAP